MRKFRKSPPKSITSEATKPLADSSNQLQNNLKAIKENIGNSPDLIIREIKKFESPDTVFAVVHIDGLSDKKVIHSNIIQPLTYLSKDIEIPDADIGSYNQLETLLSVSSLMKTDQLDDTTAYLLNGDTVIVTQGSSSFLIATTGETASRSIEEPTSQTVIRGPKDSFTENIRTNTSLVRSRIKSPHLKIGGVKLGKLTQTNVEYMYIKGIIDPALLKELEERIQTIEVDQILDSSYIETLIQDHRESPFPTLISTERPDVVAANLLEGRFAVFVAGTPFVLIGPSIFIQFFQSPEDYYYNPYISTFLRGLRFVSFFLSLYPPGLYIALLSHHAGLIPSLLVFSLAGQREGVPFPIIVEVLIMEMAFEILREAAVRMPRAVGNTISIVGALIIGQAAVEAGFVSAATVIVVSITAIASFTLPNYNLSNTARVLRFTLIISGAYIGLYGILLASIIILTHLCSLRSFGMPYIAPLAPFRLGKQKDAIVRTSLSPSPTATENQRSSVGNGGDRDD
ncbi:spore germination protein [Bacillus sp. V59.32b]|uniref:spore germination protein n=1 Tax=Bacillus sp. V59.32b TaxID=1758642 RepID=UPI000E3D4E77|nr:spore germination protein [Bacillus sp. V59.32b]RFU60366.1 spore germination protein [Bacillus sp. V59.32b]